MPRLDAFRGRVVKCYGVAAAMWKVLISLSLTLGAAAIWPGIGLALAVLGVVFWYGIPLYHAAKYAIFGSEVEQPNRLRFIIASSLLVGAIGFLAYALPGPNTVSAPLLVEYDPLTVVRAKSPGFVTELLVATGDRISVGQPLVRMSNPDIASKLKQIKLDVDRTSVDARSHLREDDVVAYQTAMKSLEALTKQREQLEHDVASLSVVAEIEGVVLSSDLDTHLGNFIHRGEEIVSIGDPTKKRAVALFEQDEAAAVRASKDKEVDVRFFGRWGNSLRGTVSRVSPRARIELDNELFALRGGGGLTVVASSVNTSAELNASPSMHLVRPRIRAEITIPEVASSQLLAGQYGRVELNSARQSLGQYCWNELGEWVSRRVRFNHGM